jgi:hypothetical protein
MRRVIAVAAIACLACSDSTGSGLGLDGPSFMRARIGEHPFLLQEGNVLRWGWSRTDGALLYVQGLPKTLAPDGNEFFYIQVGAYTGPGTYTLDGSRNTIPAENAGEYGQFDGNGTPTQEFETGGEYTGSIRIIAVDTTSGTITGTFAFSARATLGSGGAVQVTEGSFRIKN